MQKPEITLLFLFILCSTVYCFSQISDLPRSRSFMGVRVTENAGGPGVVVKEVFPNSTAAAAGLIAGDVLLMINDRTISDVASFLHEVRPVPAGGEIQLRWRRGDQEKEQRIPMAPMPMEENPAFETIYSAVQNGGNLHRTLMTRPNGSGPFPAIFIIGGVGCYTFDLPFGGGLYPLIDSLTRMGYVTYRVEKSGMGDSKGVSCETYDFQTEVNGIRAGLKALKNYAFVDAGHVYLFGLSMGGVIAPLVARENPVSGIVVYGTIAKTWTEYELANSRRQYLLSGKSFGQIHQELQVKEQVLHALFAEKKSPESIAKIHPEWEELVNFYPQHYTYFQQVADVNFGEVWSKVPADVLAIHGQADFVSSADDHQLIADIVNQSPLDNQAVYLELEYADHWFNDVSTEEESFARHNNSRKNYEIIPIIDQWIKTRKKKVGDR